MTTRKLEALKKLKSWIQLDGDYSRLCQFSWRHNRDTAAVFNYPVIIDKYDQNSLETAIDEMVLEDPKKKCNNLYGSGKSPTRKTLSSLGLTPNGYFDIVAIHKGVPVYAFNLVDPNSKQKVSSQSLTGDYIMLEVYTIWIEDILQMGNESPPPELKVQRVI